MAGQRHPEGITVLKRAYLLAGALASLCIATFFLATIPTELFGRARGGLRMAGRLRMEPSAGSVAL